MIVLMSCNDKPGIVSILSNIVFQNKGNILDLQQHVEIEENRYFMRLSIDNSTLSNENKKNIKEQIYNAFVDFDSKISFFDESKPISIGVFVTKESLPLYDILIKHSLGELNCNIPIIAKPPSSSSNSPLKKSRSRWRAIDMVDIKPNVGKITEIDQIYIVLIAFITDRASPHGII